jgi:hypothetical protein
MMPKGRRLRSSERRIAANRRNALLSTGPRSAAGRGRVSKNALRHGLAVRVLEDPRMAVDVETLARALSDQEDRLLAQARIVAESELDLERIQQANVSLINSRIASVASRPQQADIAAGAGAQGLRNETLIDRRGPDDRMRSEVLGEAMVELSPELWKLTRYERRASSRRNKAMKELLNLKGT